MNNRNSVKIILLLLYSALFVVSEIYFLLFLQKDHAVITTGAIPYLYALIVAATLLALALIALERGNILLWGFIIHLQFLFCYIPFVYNLIPALHRGLSFSIGFNAGILVYAMLPINAFCIIAYYIWAASAKLSEAGLRLSAEAGCRQSGACPP